jgi:hypothetical protein
MEVAELKGRELLQLGLDTKGGTQGGARSPADGGQKRGGGSAGRAVVARYNGHFSLADGWGVARK